MTSGEAIHSSRDVKLPDDRPLTVDDLELLPEDGSRCELAYGVLEVEPGTDR